MPTKRVFEEQQQHHVAETHPQHPQLRALLPKKGWEPLSKPLPVRLQRTAQPKKACPVPACTLVNCHLRTHQQYTRRPRSFSQSSSSSSTVSSRTTVQDDETSTPSIYNRAPTKRDAQKIVPRTALHGLEGLPDSIGDSPLFRDLFHEFCSQTFDRVAILLSPPPISADRRKTCVARAMTSQAYCLNAIASVSNDKMMKRKHIGGDRTAAMLHGRAMAALREKIASFDTGEIDNLLLIIMTLALFDIAHQSLSNLGIHRQGMEQLVNRIGGVHNLTFSLPIVLHLDRIFAIYTGSMPLYARLIDRTIQRPSRFPEVYASFFSVAGDGCVESDVRHYCCDVSRILELLEGANISFDPKIANLPVASADVLYFYFSRERVAIHFTYLNHKYWDQSDPSRCVLLTTKIIDYIILVDNYINVIPQFLAAKLKETLKSMQAKKRNSWQRHEEVLRWILCVLVMMRGVTDHDEWTVEQLRMLLLAKYKNFQISSDWQRQELQHMKRFVWCSSRLDAPFLEVCARLVSSRRSITNGGPPDRSLFDSMRSSAREIVT